MITFAARQTHARPSEARPSSDFLLHLPKRFLRPPPAPPALTPRIAPSFCTPPTARSSHQARFDKQLAEDITQAIGFMFLIVVFAMWCASSIAGAGMGLARSILAICGAVMFALALVLVYALPVFRHLAGSAVVGWWVRGWCGWWLVSGWCEVVSVSP